MKYKKLPFTFDVEKLKSEIGSLPDNEYYQIYNPYVEQDTLSAIHFIEPEVGIEPPRFTPNKNLENRPELARILGTIKSAKETFRVHTLKSGAQIKKHRDIGRNFETGVFRIHIPVQYPNEVSTLLDDELINWKEGECWYLDLNLPHEIQNQSPMDRIHLVMDCVRNEWWDELLDEGEESTEQDNQFKYMTPEELLQMKSLLTAMNSDQNNTIISQINKQLAKQSIK